MFYIELILIGICLSLDAFSLAVSISLNYINKSKIKIYSFLVGVFHFFMPLLGYIFKLFINSVIYIPNEQIVIIVILFLIAEIILDKKANKTVITPFIFSFSVSIDSFSVGITLSSKYLLVSSFIFSIISFTFTYLGFLIGNKLSKKISNNSKIISISILLIVLLYNILK